MYHLHFCIKGLDYANWETSGADIRLANNFYLLINELLLLFFIHDTNFARHSVKEQMVF